MRVDPCFTSKPDNAAIALKTSTSPTISIIMSMRNGASTVGDAVQSIIWQTFHDWEFIVIDDGSSDRSADIVRTYVDDRIRLIEESSSAGLAQRLNQAVGLSRGEFIARMDADDICFPERLSRQLATLMLDNEIDLLGCGAVVFASDGKLIGELPVKVTHAEISAQPLRGFPLPHPTWFGRASWFKAHPYNPGLLKTQDQDLLLRTFAGSRFSALDDVLMGYRQDTLQLRKILRGRRAFVGSLWRHARSSGQFLPAVIGGGMQALKGGVDIVTSGLGVSQHMQKMRLLPVSPATGQRWLELQSSLASLRVKS